MRTVSIKLRNYDHLQDLNSILMSLHERSTYESDCYIIFLNIRDLLKKLADKMFNYSQRRVKGIRLNIEINQFSSLQELLKASGAILNEPNLIYFRILLMDIIEQGIKSFDEKYFFEIKSNMKPFSDSNLISDSV